MGETLGRYQVRRMLGAGGMGQVYLARDVVLGRSAALKIVLGSFDTALFLDEARAIARLNHPNIVHLYDFGQYRSGLYLALEYIAGITLRDRARESTLELDEILRHARAVADALAHAHAAGVYHCDLKPGNIMIGHDGRVRVVDFGLARTSDTRELKAGGTPDWMAPEQWQGAPPTDRVDAWALGIVTAELLTGVHPLGADAQTRRDAVRDPERVASFACAREGVPGSIIDVITRSLERDPARRPSALEWRTVLDDAIAGRSETLGEDGPYPGLAAFDEQRARYYFGREAEIDEFLERLRLTPALPIVGPSGAGKSSFLHAGVIPRLRAKEPWIVIAFRPGADPVGALARQLVRAGDEREPVALRAELMATPTLLAARALAIARESGARVLIAVDQLEEVFTQGAPEVECMGFLAMLLAASDDPADPLRVVMTVRDDFVGGIAGLRALFVMQRLDAAALRRTITAPLERFRYELEDPQIADELIADTTDLPLLQFACRTLWDGRDAKRRKLLRATLREMGGVAGALARHAERAVAELPVDQRPLARQVLLHLVSGTTRRTVARARLVELVPGAERVVDSLLGSRLIVRRGDADNVEIAHESLLQSWEQLARWVDESREERRLLDELGETVALWERRGKRVEETWSRDDLVAIRHRAQQLQLAFPAHIEAFLATGEQRHRKRQRSRRRRFGLALAAAGIVVAVAFILVARYLRREQLIRTNAGTIDLVLIPFDKIDGGPVPIAELPELTWKLYAPKTANQPDESKPLPENVVQVLDDRVGTDRHTWHVHAPGGAAFLRIDGRGREGESCEPSWIRLNALPGYATDTVSIELTFPSCRATQQDLITIPAGPFWYGGPGDTPSKHYREPDYTEPETLVDQAAYAIDRTEVSNGAFTPFARLEPITGYPPPVYATLDQLHERDHLPDSPVTEIDWFEADAYCRYLGKRLPGDHEWVKAARGGVDLDGHPNAHPKRLFPWGPDPDPKCANQDGDADGFPWISPVDALPSCASPYGVLNLAGNAQEWIDRAGQIDPENPQYALRGGGADSPFEEEHVSTIYRNHRDPRRFDYSVGFRCVYSPGAH